MKETSSNRIERIFASQQPPHAFLPSELFSRLAVSSHKRIRASKKKQRLQMLTIYANWTISQDSKIQPSIAPMNFATDSRCGILSKPITYNE